MKTYAILFAIALAVIVRPICASTNPISGAGISGQEGKNYYCIIDYTQGQNLNAIVTNTQVTSTINFPLTGFEYPPIAAINPNFWPSNGTAKLNPDLYVEVDTNNSDVKDPTATTTATDNTCYQNLSYMCPDTNIPQTFIHMTGTYSGGTVTALTNNTLLPTKKEDLLDDFSLNAQAFDMDRLRYAANRVWAQWNDDVNEAVNSSARTGNWYVLSKGYNPSPTNTAYQLTGTMSFENFLDNVVNARPMYGIVRVVIPTDFGSGILYADTAQPIEGKEFASSYTWDGGDNKQSTPSYSDSSMISGTNLSTLVQNWSRKVEGNSNPNGEVIVYGTLIMDYVDARTYDPDDFISSAQDYVDNETSVTAHDLLDTSSTPPTGLENFILPRSQSQTENLTDNESLEINPTAVNTNNRVASADTAQTYMWKGSVNFASSDVPDAAIFEYWMRQAAINDPTSSTYTGIINDLASSGQTQYDYATQTFTSSSAARRTDFIDNVWSTLAEKDQFHSLFPNGYEHGWMMAFDALRMDALDATTASPTIAGSWWSNLTQPNSGTVYLYSGSTPYDPTGFTTPTSAQNYSVFGIPSNANQDITVDVNGDGHATDMPNFFTTSWEDMPAFCFTGGYLNIQGFANIGGMVYTPDSSYIAPGAGTTAAATGAQEYLNGALLAGNGIYIGGSTNNNQLIAIAYDANAFDRLRTLKITMTTKIEDITEIQGQ